MNSGVHERVIAISSPELFRSALLRAAGLLRSGDIVAVPTETVYGLAADARNAAAVAKVFAAKGRPAHNPVIVHVAGLEMARRCVAAWPTVAERLAQAFWPGPLTLVLPKAEAIPELVTAGSPTVGIRWSSHPFLEALILECGFPLAAPSANLSNQISPTTAEHVRRSLGRVVALIVDGGPCRVGLESTVLDLTSRPPQVLRPGMIHSESLRAVLGELGEGTVSAASTALRSPGQLPRHYAPRARLVVMSWHDAKELRAELSMRQVPANSVRVIAHTNIPAAAGFGGVSVIPHDPEAFARTLYAELHRCDDEGAECIVVEAVPESPEWTAIADRLRRAAA